MLFRVISYQLRVTSYKKVMTVLKLPSENWELDTGNYIGEECPLL